MRIRLTSLMATMLWLQDGWNHVTAAADSTQLYGHIDLVGVASYNTPATLNITLTSPGKKSTLVSVWLCQGVSESPTSKAIYKIQKLQDFCVVSDPSNNCPENLKALNVRGGQSTAAQFTINSQAGTDRVQRRQNDQATSNSLNGYFFCGSLDSTNCHVYSEYLFSLGGVGNPPAFAIPSTDVVMLPATSVPFTVASISTTLSAFPATTAASNPGGGQVSITSMITTSLEPTGTKTVQPSSEPSSSGSASSSTSKSSGGLSVGAKAGIAVGALGVLFLILLAALFFLRRAHRKKRAHNSEQVMLNRSVANDSRDLMAEKEAGHTSPSSFDAPVPVFAGGMGTGERPGSGGRHSALSPYEQIPSQPYSGSAAAVPRRKATTSAPSNAQSRGLDSIPASEPLATAGLVSRGVSNASTNIVSPRSPVAPSSSDPSDRSHEFEEYHDVPVYGDARHVPQVFNGGLQAPFLGESSGDNLSNAEAARLAEEEEERRIDAAIAEAERAKGGGR